MMFFQLLSHPQALFWIENDSHQLLLQEVIITVIKASLSLKLFKQFHELDLYHYRKLGDFAAEATLSVLLAEVNNFEFVVKVSYW